MAVESNFGTFRYARGVATSRDDDATVELYPDTMQIEVESFPDTMAIDNASAPRLPELTVQRMLLADAARQEVDPFHVGATLRDRYRIESVLGRGGCAIIYRARDLRVEDTASELAHVAIKVLRPELRGSGPAVERLKRGFRGLRLFTHANVVRVFDLDCHDGHWFEVMELLEGETLARYLHRRLGTQIPERTALAILSAAADALATAHGHGVVHGDIKPGNFFLLRSGELRLLDFGGDSGTGLRGPILATPAYASPELLAGMTPEPRDDVFSLACVACELLTGKHPFGRVDARTAIARGAKPSVGSSLASARTAALARGLAARRADRPASVHELIDALQEPRAAPAPLAAETAAKAMAPLAAPARARVRALRVPLALAVLPVLATVLSVAGFILYEAPVPPALAATPAVTQSVDQPAQFASAPAGLAGNQVDAMRGLAASIAAIAQPPVADATLAERQYLSFSTSRMAVSSAANLAALPVRRSGPAAGITQLAWRIHERTAVAGRHFSGPLSGVVPFTEGQLASTIFIPIVPGQAESGEREFAVTIERVAGQARIGDVDRITVQLR
ncbi:MAG: protein kinase domain-containing protein [Steroidobacteraceae bacterium]